MAEQEVNERLEIKSRTFDAVLSATLEHEADTYIVAIACVAVVTQRCSIYA